MLMDDDDDPWWWWGCLLSAAVCQSVSQSVRVSISQSKFFFFLATIKIIFIESFFFLLLAFVFCGEERESRICTRILQKQFPNMRRVQAGPGTSSYKPNTSGGMYVVRKKDIWFYLFPKYFGCRSKTVIRSTQCMWTSLYYAFIYCSLKVDCVCVCVCVCACLL